MSRGSRLDQVTPDPTRSDNAGRGSRTVAVPEPEKAPTNGRVAPYGAGQPNGVLPGDYRTADDVEAWMARLR
jgi:hypothetical protein